MGVGVQRGQKEAEVIRYVVRGFAMGLGFAAARWLLRWLTRAGLAGAVLWLLL